MKKFLISLASVLSLCALTVPAMAAETVSCPERTVGATYEFAVANNPNSPNFRLTVVSKEGNLIRVENSPRNITSVRDVMFNIRQKDGSFFTASPRCPFTLGSKQANDVNYVHGASGAEIAAKQTVTVGGAWESVTVPAGTFKVVKVVMAEEFTWFNPKSGGRGTGTVTETSYYAPDIGIRVSIEIDAKPSEGQHTYNVLKLASYDLKK